MQWDGVHDLIERAKRGDKSAWEALVVMAQPLLLGLARKLRGADWPEKSVADLFQNTWTLALLNLKDFRGGQNDAQTGATFRSWLSRIMANAHRNELRGSRLEQLIHPDAWTTGGSQSGDGWSQFSAGVATPSTESLMQEQTLLVRQAMDALPESDRELVRFRFFDDLTYDEIAVRLKIDPTTVSYRLGKLLDRLGVQLKELK